MSLLTEVTSASPGWFATAVAGIGAGGLALMTVVRQYSANRKDNAVDKGVASAYEMLTRENERLAKQVGELSILMNQNFSQKLDMMGRVAELERKLQTMGDIEKENGQLREEMAELRKENHDLRDKVQVLEFRMSGK